MIVIHVYTLLTFITLPNGFGVELLIDSQFNQNERHTFTGKEGDQEAQA